MQSFSKQDLLLNTLPCSSMITPDLIIAITSAFYFTVLAREKVTGSLIFLEMNHLMKPRHKPLQRPEDTGR